VGGAGMIVILGGVGIVGGAGMVMV
jgi:hypothetical protein